MVRCGDGEYAPHVVHWQTEKTRVLYDKATQLFGRLCCCCCYCAVVAAAVTPPLHPKVVEKELFRVSKAPGKEHVPEKPRKGRIHAVEKGAFQLVDSEKLAQRRKKSPDVTGCDGIMSHYQFRLMAKGKVKMRWLSCPCQMCFARDWDACVNQERVGRCRDVFMHELTKHGGTDRQQRRSTMSNTMADGLKGGEIVAMFTQEDLCDHRYWVAKVVGEAWITNFLIECPISGEQFDQGDRIVKVEYFERVGREAHVFRFRPELGVFWVRTSLLRGRVELQPYGRVSHRNQTAHDTISNRNLEITEKSHNEIIDRIENCFGDNEGE